MITLILWLAAVACVVSVVVVAAVVKAVFAFVVVVIIVVADVMKAIAFVVVVITVVAVSKLLCYNHCYCCFCWSIINVAQLLTLSWNPFVI